MPTKSKSNLHPNNQHQGRYDFKTLIASCPALKPFVFVNEYDSETINFFDPEAVKMLNKALLKHYYSIDFWDIPFGYLCPPIPGRADYLYYLTDLLKSVYKKTPKKKLPKGNKIKCLDIGVGANCIYPILGNKLLDWSFIGAEIDSKALKSATKIITSNKFQKGSIELRFQANPNNIFKGILEKEEYIDFTICNPPFHASAKEAQKATNRKLTNLTGKRIKDPDLNFGGRNQEIWCEGGEKAFIQKMIFQSKGFANNCFWFTTLVSKKANLYGIRKALKKVKTRDIRILEMGQGNKVSRIVAWTFLDPKQQRDWMELKLK